MFPKRPNPAGWRSGPEGPLNFHHGVEEDSCGADLPRCRGLASWLGLAAASCGEFEQGSYLSYVSECTWDQDSYMVVKNSTVPQSGMSSGVHSNHTAGRYFNDAERSRVASKAFSVSSLAGWWFEVAAYFGVADLRPGLILLRRI